MFKSAEVGSREKSLQLTRVSGQDFRICFPGFFLRRGPPPLCTPSCEIMVRSHLDTPMIFWEVFSYNRRFHMCRIKSEFSDSDIIEREQEEVRGEEGALRDWSE